MSTTTIGWNEALPSDASVVGRDPPTRRSGWTAVSAGLRPALYWPPVDSSDSMGQLRPGNYRAYVGTASQSSNASTADSHARAFIATDSRRLFGLYASIAALGSSATLLAGTGRCLLSATTPASGGVWVERSGSIMHPLATSGTSSQVFTYPYSAMPTVMLTPSATQLVVSLSTVTTGGFTSRFSWFNGVSASTFTVHWRSLGTLEDTLT